MSEIMAIASSTWRRVLRMKAVYFLILCVLILIACAYNYDVLSIGRHKELMMNVSMFLNTLAAIIVAISLTFEMPKDIKSGVASTLLSKSLGRTQYLVGKLIGTIITGVVVCGLIMLGFVFVFNTFFDKTPFSIIQGHLMIIVSLIPMCAVALLFSVLLPESIAAIVTAIVIGLSFSATKLHHLKFIYGGIIPDLNLFDMRAEAIWGANISWFYMGLILVWGIVFSIFASSVASLIFGHKDLK
jgi:hypothetical protein